MRYFNIIKANYYTILSYSGNAFAYHAIILSLLTLCHILTLKCNHYNVMPYDIITTIHNNTMSFYEINWFTKRLLCCCTAAVSRLVCNIIVFSHSCCWLSLWDVHVWWDQPIWHSLIFASLISLILPFQIDIRTSKCILHRWYGETGWSLSWALVTTLSPRLNKRLGLL